MSLFPDSFRSLFNTDALVLNTAASNALPLAVATTTIVLFLGWYSSSSNRKQDRPWKLAPGWIPLLGHFHHVQALDHLVNVTSDWADRYHYAKDTGCYEIDLAGNRYVVVCRQDRALELLQHRPALVERSTVIREVVDSVGAKGIFSAEGAQWKAEHRYVAAALNKNHVKDYLQVFKVMADRLVNKWAATEQPVDTEDEDRFLLTVNTDLDKLTADTIAKVAMDRDYDFLNQPNTTMAIDVFKIMIGGFRRALSPIWYWRIPIIGQHLDGIGASANRLIALLTEIVQSQQEEENNANTSKTTATTDSAGSTQSKTFFIQKLYALMRSEKAVMPLERVIGNALTLFLAGSDTTSKALGMCLYLLAKDGSLQKQLQQHVDGFDLESASLADLYEKLPRLKSFLHEVHRFYGNGLLFFKVTKDIDFCSSRLHKGEEVLLATRYMTTSENAQVTGIPDGPNGEPCSVFCAERYLVQISDDNNGGLSTLTPKPGSLAMGTFGTGVRSCPGRTYTEALSYCILIRLLQTFEWKLAPEFPSNPGILNQNVTVLDCPVTLQFVPRNNTKKNE